MSSLVPSPTSPLSHLECVSPFVAPLCALLMAPRTVELHVEQAFGYLVHVLGSLGALYASAAESMPDGPLELHPHAALPLYQRYAANLYPTITPF